MMLGKIGFYCISSLLSRDMFDPFAQKMFYDLLSVLLSPKLEVGMKGRRVKVYFFFD